MNSEIKPKGLVVWSSLRDPDADLFRYESGLKFIEMDDSLKKSMEKFINNLTWTIFFNFKRRNDKIINE